MADQEVEAFLTYLALGRHVATSTHTVPASFRENQALSALLLIYRHVLENSELELKLNAVRSPLDEACTPPLRRPQPMDDCLTGPEL